MTTYTPPAEAVEAACRAVHPTRWEYPATAHPCDDCTTAVTAAGPIIAAQARERCRCAWCCASNPPGVKAGGAHEICPAQRATLTARGEGS